MTELEIKDRRIAELEREVAHWKNNHETEVRRARVLKERTDMPLERVQAYKKWGEDQQRIAELEAIIELAGQQEAVATVDANDNEYWADIMPDRSVYVGQYLFAHPDYASAARITELEQQNAMLLWALNTFIDEHEEVEDADGWMAFMCSPEAFHSADEALEAAKGGAA